MQQVKQREVPRQDVIRTLAKSVSTHCLTTVTAPAGYGKTTIAQKLLGYNQKNRFFHSIPDDIADPVHWWDSLFAHLVKQGLDAAPTLRRQGFPQSESSTRRVIEVIKGISPPFTLILDDCQNFVDAAVDVFLETLIRSEPSEHRFVLFSRVKPQMNLDDLEDAGLAAVFDQKLLEFSESEAARFFFLNGVSDKTATKNAWRYSEGWVTALWLCLQNHKNGMKTPPVGDINALLDKAVFAAYSEADRKFLMKLSVLDSFTDSEAALILGVPDVLDRLSKMNDGNALIRFDAVSGRHVFHSIFKEFLAKKLTARNDLNTSELYRRAAECHVARHEYMTAYRLLAKAGRDEDLIRILDVLLLQNGQNARCIQVREIIDIVRDIPWRLRLKHPLGYMAFVWYSFEDGLDAAGVALLEEADRRFRRAKEIPKYLKRRLAGEAEFMRGWLYMYDEPDMLIPRYQNAFELLDGPSIIRYDRMCWNFCIPHLLFISLMKSVLFQRDISHQLEMVATLLHKLTGGVAEGLRQLCKVENHLERSEFDDAANLLDDIEQLLDSRRNMTSWVVARFSRARLLAATGKLEESVTSLGELLSVAKAADSYEHIQSAELALGYALANAMRPDSAPGWLLDCDILGPPYGDTRIQCFMATVCGKLLLAKGDLDGLASFLTSTPEIFGPADLVFSGMHAAVFRAILAWSRKDADDALAGLREAVEISRPDGFILSLAEYGGHILPMLRRLKKDAPDDAHLDKLVKLTGAIEQSRLRQEKKNRCILSGRECEVMNLVVKGKATLAIAKKMNIGESAVKKLLAAAYRKLSARNRAQAAYRFQMEYLNNSTTTG